MTKFEATDGPMVQPCVNFLGQTSVTAPRNFFGLNSVIALCYSSVLFRKQRKIHPRGMRAGQPKRLKRREAPSLNWLLFLYVFLLLLGLPYVNWASQECYLFYLRSSLWSSDLPLFYFLGFFPSVSFSHLHSGLLFHILPT